MILDDSTTNDQPQTVEDLDQLKKQLEASIIQRKNDNRNNDALDGSASLLSRRESEAVLRSNSCMKAREECKFDRTIIDRKLHRNQSTMTAFAHRSPSQMNYFGAESTK